MTRYEALKILTPSLQQAYRCGVTLRDTERLGVYEEYMRRKRSGEKVAAIACDLCERYSMDRATLFRYVSRFNQQVNV